jgi:DNA-binding NarL/FixJ family response regulator
MENMRSSALVISRNSSLREGLIALLDAMPQICVVKTSDSLEGELENLASGHPPAVVVLDGRTSGSSTWLAVRRVKARWPGSKCVVLAETAAQQAEAEGACADAVLANGFPAARLVATIVRLLPQAEVDDQFPTTASERRFGAGKRGLRCTGPGARGPRRESKPASRNSRLALAPQAGNHRR